jgi:hypothetical protein
MNKDQTFVPQPVNTPNPSVAVAETHGDAVDENSGGYEGSNDGTIAITKSGLDTSPATIGRLFSSFKLPGCNRHDRRIDETPNTRPLCRSKPNEPLNRSRAPIVV